VSLWADETLNWRFVGELAEQAYRTVASKRMLALLDSSRDDDRRPRGKVEDQA
jgi:hypothetical protein